MRNLPAPFVSLSRILGKAYGQAVRAKNFLYDSDIADQIVIGKPVLSVGNISMGGTGKTPVVELLISLCLEKGLKPCLIARNYKAQSVGTHQVDLQRPSGARFYGDEAYSIAQKFPHVPVFTGPRKSETARYAEEKSVFDILIVDDGFQHRALYRDFDLVLVDATADEAEDFLFPAGRLREGFGSLQRSSLVALTKVNWVSEEKLQAVQKQIPSQVSQVQIEFFHQPQKEITEGSRVLVVSGIAKPEIFEQALKPVADLAECLRFSDHHRYSENDIIQISQRFRLLDCQHILTTEKDFVKLKEYPALLPYLNPIGLKLKLKSEPKELYAFLDRCFCR